jgi:hypothetical protein
MLFRIVNRSRISGLNTVIRIFAFPVTIDIINFWVFKHRSIIKRYYKGTYYDTIAEPYQKVYELPQNQHIDAYTYFRSLGELTGKSILDLACGEGFYQYGFYRQ